MTYPIPNAALDDRLGFVGTSGSGKTYAAGTAVERLLARKARVVVVDPLGVWWGLRLAADGAAPSKFGVIIFGGPRGDLPITEHAGALIGETVAGMSESCVLDLSELGTKAAERRFMLAFTTALYRKATGEPVHVVFDEADMWAPQKLMDKEGEAAKLLGQMETLVRRGRVKGFIPWLITQRPAVLNKDVLSQVDGLVAMKLTSSQDRAALDGWIEGSADRAQAKAILGSLPAMNTGEGVVWIPGRSVMGAAAFPPKTTFDSSRTPRRGEKRQAVELKPLDVEALKGRLATVEEAAAQDDPRRLRRRIVELEQMVRQMDRQKNPAVPPIAALERAEAKGYAKGKIDGAAEAHDLNKRTTLALIEMWSGALDTASALLGDLRDSFKASRKDLEREARRVPAEVKRYPVNGIISTVDLPGVTTPAKAHAIAVDAMKKQRSNAEAAAGDVSISSGGRAILAGLAWWKAIGFAKPSRAQVAAVAGVKVGGSTLRARLAELRLAGLVEYPEDSSVAFTAAGEAAAPPPPAGSLLEIFRAQLGSGAQAILDWLLEVGGEADRDQIAAAASIERGGSTLRARLAELRTLEAVEYPTKGTVRVQEWLARSWGREA